MAERTVTTTGHGAARVARDAASVRLTARHAASALTAALAGAESARAFAVEVCHRHVAATAVGTTGVEVWPQNDVRGRPSGFEARHSLVVRCEDLEVAAALVGDLAAAVGDRLVLDGVTLTASDTTDAQRTAREHAFSDARARAEHLAVLGGVELGDLVSLSEGSVAPGGPGVEALATRAAGPEVDLQPGEADIVAAVTGTWTLRDQPSHRR